MINGFVKTEKNITRVSDAELGIQEENYRERVPRSARQVTMGAALCGMEKDMGAVTGQAKGW